MANRKDSLGDRMKGYEHTARHHLMRRMPVIIRVDGKAFHTFVKRLRRHENERCGEQDRKDPFSLFMHDAMKETMRALCANIQNAVFGYTQSDEISVLLRDWDTFETAQWFDGNLQKLCSVSASMAATAFNFHLTRVCDVPFAGFEELAQFDARVYNLPREEVTNYFLWRQQDATRNSISMLGQFHFSHKRLHGQSSSRVQDMLMLEKGVNWNDLATWKKRGTGCFKHHFKRLIDADTVIRTAWVIDDEMPIISKRRQYVERHLDPSSGSAAAAA